jgi:uncharacterized protein
MKRLWFLCLLLTFIYSHSQPRNSSAAYNYEDSVMVTTRDGAKIAITIVRQKDISTPLPVIFVFNIYSNLFNDRGEALMAAQHNYIGVVANTRGKRLSPQEIEPFEHDANDAYDIIDWISKQPWCNGKIGMYGGSYLGFTQWAALKKIHPALKTIVPQVAAAPGIDLPTWNGVFHSWILRWLHAVTNNKSTDYGDYSNQRHWDSVYLKWYNSGRPFEAMDSLEGRPSTIFHRWLLHPSYDSFWRNMTPDKNEFGKINIPILSITGYFDDEQMGALYYVKQHYQYNRDANHYFVIGPYDHEGTNASPPKTVLNYTIDPVANINFTNLIFQWLDYILKDSSRPAFLENKINYQVMGTNQWKHVPSFDKMNNDTLVLYLSTHKEGDDYTLVGQKPAQEEMISQELPYGSKTVWHDEFEKPAMDTLLRKDGLLAFFSAPLEKPVAINGSFTAELFATINKKDMDIAMGLYEETPDGKFFNLSYYFVGRASYARNRSKRQLLHPGKKERIPATNTFFTSRQLSKGSRIVVLLGMNNSQYWEINYGTGRDVSEETRADGKIPLFLQWSNSSHIEIPVYR